MEQTEKGNPAYPLLYESWGTIIHLKAILGVISELNKMNCELMLTYDKNQLSLQTGSRNLKGPKMLPTI